MVSWAHGTRIGDFWPAGTQTINPEEFETSPWKSCCIQMNNYMMKSSGLGAWIGLSARHLRQKLMFAADGARKKQWHNCHIHCTVLTHSLLHSRLLHTVNKSTPIFPQHRSSGLCVPGTGFKVCGRMCSFQTVQIMWWLHSVLEEAATVLISGLSSLQLRSQLPSPTRRCLRAGESDHGYWPSCKKGQFPFRALRTPLPLCNFSQYLPMEGGVNSQVCLNGDR